MTHVELRTGRRVPVVEPEPTMSGEPLVVAPVPAAIEPPEGWNALVQCTWCGRRCWVTFMQLGAIPEGSAAAPVCQPCATPFLEVRLTPEGTPLPVPAVQAASGRARRRRMALDNLAPVIERVSPHTREEALAFAVVVAGYWKAAESIHRYVTRVLESLPDGWALVDTRSVATQAGTLMAALADIVDEDAGRGRPVAYTNVTGDDWVIADGVP